MKKALALTLVCAMSATLLAGCGGGTSSGSSSEATGANAASAVSADLPTIDSINLGEDYQDISATIRVLTNRTDIVDTVYAGYAQQFQELYPNITVEYEAVTDYLQVLLLPRRRTGL